MSVENHQGHLLRGSERKTYSSTSPRHCICTTFKYEGRVSFSSYFPSSFVYYLRG
jgi:hypothetical protein